MNIYINEDQLDFKLEKEKTLMDVLNSLDKWLDQEGHQLETLLVDGAPLESDNIDDWRDTPIGSIKKIEITSSSKVESRLNYLQALYQFFLLLQRSLEEKNDPLLKQISTNYPVIQEKLNQLFPSANTEGQTSFTDKLDDFLVSSGIFQTGKVPENPEGLIDLVSKLNLIISELTREITNPLSELITTVQLLKAIVPEMEEVSVLLQTGQDKEAMDSIVKFTELSQKLLRIYPNLLQHGIIDISKEKIQGKSFDIFYKEFNLTLIELTKAFQSNDSILIGDLLEYEIAPRLEDLTGILEKVQTKED